MGRWIGHRDGVFSENLFNVVVEEDCGNSDANGTKEKVMFRLQGQQEGHRRRRLDSKSLRLVGPLRQDNNMATEAEQQQFLDEENPMRTA